MNVHDGGDGSYGEWEHGNGFGEGGVGGSGVSLDVLLLATSFEDCPGAVILFREKDRFVSGSLCLL